MTVRIAMTMWRRSLPTFIADATDLHTLGAEYPQAILDAGGLPILLPTLDPGDAHDALEGMDGLVLVGGDDVTPELYGRHGDGAQHTNPAADRSDLALVHAAVECQLPVFGICRGLQVLNVAFGGTLHLDITSPDGVHRPVPTMPGEAMQVRHDVEIAADSWLAGVYRTTRRRVNSLHHQAIDRLADGFRPTAWAADGIIEAVESTVDGRDAWGVQWHPEKITGEGDQVLFDAWVERVRERRRARRA